jgi:hypothetical protein
MQAPMQACACLTEKDLFETTFTRGGIVMSEPVIVPTAIDTVTVFNGSALVTRRGAVPLFESGDQLELLLEGLPLSMDDGSIRTSITDTAGEKDTESGEKKVSKRIRFAHSSSWAVRNIKVEVDCRGSAENPDKTDDLDRETEIKEVLASLNDLGAQTAELRKWIATQPPAADPEKERGIFPYNAWEAFIRSCETKLAIRESEEAAHRARLEALKKSRLEKSLTLEPSEKPVTYFKNVRLTIAKIENSTERPREVEVSYIVPGARWRPAYKLYIHDNYKKARLVMGALVAQKTGEDWQNARLRFSAAELTRITQLSELPSRRIGRAQPAKPPSFRKKLPPSSSLFAGFDEWYSRVKEKALKKHYSADELINASLVKLDELLANAPLQRMYDSIVDKHVETGKRLKQSPMGNMPMGGLAPGRAGGAYQKQVFSYADHMAFGGEAPPTASPKPCAPPPPPAFSSDLADMVHQEFGSLEPPELSAPMPSQPATGGFAADMVMRRAEPEKTGKPMMQAAARDVKERSRSKEATIKFDLLPTKAKSFADLFSRKDEYDALSTLDEDDDLLNMRMGSSGAGPSGGGGATITYEPVTLPGNYFSYELPAPDSLGPEKRGMLVPARSLYLTERVRIQEGMMLQMIWHTSRAARIPVFEDVPVPSFQCVYEARGSAQVPGDGFIHRVDIMNAEVESAMNYRTVPLTDPQVFGRLRVRNPFEFPIPEGQVQIFVENAYMFTSPLKGVGRDGEALFPMGVEQKLKISRNTVFHQDERGIAGGNSVAVHTVEIALRSHMTEPVKVEIIERLPVRDENEKKIEVKVNSLEPKGEAVEFIDDERVRGAHRWVVAVEPGEEKSVRLEFQITIPSKMEILGGNRRI